MFKKLISARTIMAFSAARNLGRGLLNQGRLFLMNSISKSQAKSLAQRTSFIDGVNVNNFRFYCQESSQWVTITFQRHDGSLLKRKGKVGDSIQEVIGTDNPDFPGYGACDGTISCSTCHVILATEDFKRMPEATSEEEDTLDLSPCLEDTSRLGCCIEITKDMDGMVLKLPAEVKDRRDEQP